MPTYCFRNEKTGQVIERVFDMAGVPQIIKEGGKVFERDFQSEHVGAPPTKGWPIECIASGVHPNQADELRSHFRKNGLNIPVTRDGNPVYADANQRRKGLKCRNLMDKASYI